MKTRCYDDKNGSMNLNMKVNGLVKGFRTKREADAARLEKNE